MLDKTGVSKLWAASKGLFVPKEAGKGLSENDFSDSYKGKIDGLTESYTFVVNSDEALLAWANAEAGNDYTHVLIKSGTWDMCKPEGINLTAAGTLTVTGEPGNKIRNICSIAGIVYGLRRDTIEDNYDTYVSGVNLYVENNHKGTNSSGVPTYTKAYAFAKLCNLTNCSASLCAIASAYSFASAYGFSACKRLQSCNANTGLTSTSPEVMWFHAFDNCSQLYACAACRTAGPGCHMQYGFTNCQHLVNCFADCAGEAKAQAFGNCKRLIGCSGSISSAATSGVACYSACEYLYGCYAYASMARPEGYTSCKYLIACSCSVGGGVMYGFNTCHICVACTSVRSGVNGGGSGFKDCVGVQYCYDEISDYNNPTGSSAYFTHSSANVGAYDATYACANTPEGGWNTHSEKPSTT